MNLLQLTSDYSKQNLYSKLFTKLQSLGINQEIYVPVRSSEEIGKFDLSALSNTRINYSNILHKYHRFFFHLKIFDVYKDLKRKIPLNTIELTHAHFLFSDGAVALRLKKEFDIPYVVTIRNTDVNIFFRYMVHLRQLGRKIMLEADQIILLTPAYINLIIDKYIPLRNKEEIRRKIKIIPSGIDDFWLQNKPSQNIANQGIIRLIYVGDFTKNKNVISIIEAGEQLAKKNVKISLTIVGGGGDNEKMILKKIKRSFYLKINYVGRIEDKKQLLEYYRNSNIFIMPSFKETFGLVYLEAMSQGLPIIFTKEQGVDGYFKEILPGFAVNPYNIQEIKNKILEIYDNLDVFSKNALKLIDSFNWHESAYSHISIYKNIIK